MKTLQQINNELLLRDLSELITPFDRGTYWVKSRTPNTDPWLVDVESNECNCPDYLIRVHKEVKDGGVKRDCYHLKIVKEYLKLINTNKNKT